MKNITLAIDDDLLAKARRRAAEKGTTVNAFVRDQLERFVSQDDDLARAKRELVEMAQNSTLDMGPGWKWNREDAYVGERFSRFQRDPVRGDEDQQGATEGADRPKSGRAA